MRTLAEAGDAPGIAEIADGEGSGLEIGAQVTRPAGAMPIVQFGRDAREALPPRDGDVARAWFDSEGRHDGGVDMWAWAWASGGGRDRGPDLI